MKLQGQNRFLSITEIAALLSCSAATIRRMVRRRNIGYLRVGRLKRYHFAEIVERSVRVDTPTGEKNKIGQSVPRYH